jgi:lipopolysaccharide export system protein LptA
MSPIPRLPGLLAPTLLAPTLLAPALLVGLISSSPARAQGIDLSGGGPVEVTARGNFEVHENEHEVIASQDARAVRGNVTVLADQLIARYRKRQSAGGTQAGAATATAGQDSGGGNEVYRLEAHGHVRIVTPTDEAVGDDATYDIDQAVLVMTGKALRLTTPNDVMTARDTMEYWSAEHMAVGRGNAVVVTNDGRRIAADTLVAYTEPNDGKTAPHPAKTTGTAESLTSLDSLKRVDAFGNVEVRTAADIVRGDKGIYIAATGQGRVVGHARITHADNQVNGPAADFNMKTGVARINASAGSRVEGLLVPRSTGTTAPTAQSPAQSPAQSLGKPATTP